MSIPFFYEARADAEIRPLPMDGAAAIRALLLRRLFVGHNHAIRRIQGHGIAPQANAPDLNRPGAAPTVEAVAVRRLFLNPLWLLLSLPGYIGWRLLSAMSIGPVGTCAGIAVLIACCVAIPLSVRHRTIRNPRIEHLLNWVGLLSMGFFSTLFVFTVLRDLMLLLAHLTLPTARVASLLLRPRVGHWRSPQPSRRLAW